MDFLLDIFEGVIDIISRIIELFEKKETKYTIQDLEAFYCDKKVNTEGLFISDIWTKYPDWLESNHKFIQWLFPLQESSKFNHGAPVLTNEDVTYLRDNKSFQDSLNCSFWMMMQFYGIDYDDTSDQFIVTNLLRARNTWLTSFNHNQLRMTRILNCLDLFGRADLSFKLRVLLKEMHQKYNVINDDTIQYWKLDNLED